MLETETQIDEWIPKSWWWAGAGCLAVAVALPILGNLARDDASARCALDGQTIDALYAVKVIADSDGEYQFCCIICAELWMDRAGATPRKIILVDESSGEPMDSSVAYYVDGSSVLSNAPTGDRRHVFRKLEDAQSHAAIYRGRVLSGNERPFELTNRRTISD